MIVILASCGTLQATVDEPYVRIEGGYGIFRRRVPLADIASAQSVRNRWYLQGSVPATVAVNVVRMAPAIGASRDQD